MTSSLPRRLTRWEVTFVVVQLVLAFAILFRPADGADNKRFDVCQKKEDPVNPGPGDLHAGVILRVSTGNTNGLGTGRYPKCSVLLLNFEVSHRDRTELSFYSAPQASLTNDDTAKCLNWDALQTDDKSEEISTACESTTPSRKIVETWTKLKQLTLDVYDGIVKSDPLLDFEIFIQNVKPDPVVESIYTTNRLSFECNHPNPYLVPNVRKDGVDVDPSRLNGRVFDMTYGSKVPINNSGKYDCSWGDPTLPTKSVQAILYSPVILCEAFERNSTDQLVAVGNRTGNNVDVLIYEGEFLRKYEMRCSLEFAGNELESEVTMKWADPVWKPAETRDENEKRPFPHNTVVDGNYKRRSLTHDAQLNSSITYLCRVEVPDGVNFADAKPQPCAIRFATKEYIEPTETPGVLHGMPWLIPVIAVAAILILVIVVVLIMKSRQCGPFAATTRSDGVPAMAPSSVADGKSEISADGIDNVSIDTREQDLAIDNNDNDTGGGGGGGVGKGVPVVARNDGKNKAKTPKSNGATSRKPNGFVIPKEADYIPPELERQPPPEPNFPPPPPEIVYANSGSQSKTAETSDVIGITEESPYAVVLLEETV